MISGKDLAIRQIKFPAKISSFMVVIQLSLNYSFFFKQKTAYEIGVRLVGSEMCIRDRSLKLLMKGAVWISSSKFFCLFFTMIFNL